MFYDNPDRALLLAILWFTYFFKKSYITLRINALIYVDSK